LFGGSISIRCHYPTVRTVERDLEAISCLPFVVRCQACEERREEEQGRADRLDRQRGSLPLFSDVVSF
jgi:hypothetical protein